MPGKRSGGWRPTSSGRSSPRPRRGARPSLSFGASKIAPGRPPPRSEATGPCTSDFPSLWSPSPSHPHSSSRGGGSECSSWPGNPKPVFRSPQTCPSLVLARPAPTGPGLPAGSFLRAIRSLWHHRLLCSSRPRKSARGEGNPRTVLCKYCVDP